MNISAVILIISLLLKAVPSKAADHPYDPSTDLNSVFGAGCPSFNGSINALADSQAQSLTTIINNVRNDPACASVSSVLSQIQAVDFTAFNSDKGNITALKAQVQNLQAAIASESVKANDPNYAANGYASFGFLDPAYLSSLKSTLLTTSQQLITVQGTAGNDNTALKFQTIQHYQSLSSGLFSALNANQECSRKFSGLGAQVAGQILTTASTLASGFMSPILLATGGIFDSFMGYLSKRETGKDFKKINDSRIANAASCALESLSATYCQARDLKLLARAKYGGCSSCTFEGGRIISQELDALSTWLARVEAGSNATSSGTATDKKTAKDLKDSSYKLKIDLDSDISRSQQKVSAGTITEAEEAGNLLAKLSTDSLNYVSTSTYSVGTVSPPSILANAFKDDPACGPTAFLYTVGASSQCARTSPAESCNQCVARVFTTFPAPSFASLASGETKMVNLANAYVQSEVTLVEETNPLNVLSQYTKHLKNFKTPENFVVDTRAYLSLLLKDPDFQHRVDQNVIHDLQVRLDATVCELNASVGCPPLVPPTGVPIPAPNSSAEALLIVNKIHEQLLPADDLFFVSNTLSDLVKKDLDRRIEKGQIDQNLADALLLSNSDTLGTVIQATMGRDAAVSQAEGAQAQTKSNLSSLGELFNEQIWNSVDKESNADAVAKACIRAALIPGAPKLGRNNIASRCKGKVWKSVHANNNISFDEVIQKSFEDRSCTVYDFYRKSSLQDMGLGTPMGR